MNSSPKETAAHDACQLPDTWHARVAVGIATYRRPDGLEWLLSALASQISANPFEVVVADNDPLESARATIDRLSSLLRIRYLQVSTPGIAAARNAIIQSAIDVDYIVFIDDDEIPSPGWLSNMVEAQARSGQAGVAGPVRYVYEYPPPRWVHSGGFFISPDFSEGFSMPHAATNNLLLNLRLLRAKGGIPRFDEALGITGGSDTDFTRRLIRSGETIVWTKTAEVIEIVPAARCTARWAIRRAVRTGNNAAQIVLRADTWSLRGRTRVFVGGILRLLGGSAELAVSWLPLAQFRAGRSIRRACRGWGMLRELAAVRVTEYKR
ncbi:glycosyltransferase family 2 protein [Pseudonocardia halophobica]